MAKLALQAKERLKEKRQSKRSGVNAAVQKQQDPQKQEDAQKHGAQLLMGGKPLSSQKGYFFEPTILSGMTEEMQISHEESFAPIAALYKFNSEDEAVKLANATSMGLASYAFTKNIDRMWRLLENLEAGMIGMNTGRFPPGEI